MKYGIKEIATTPHPYSTGSIKTARGYEIFWQQLEHSEIGQHIQPLHLIT